MLQIHMDVTEGGEIELYSHVPVQACLIPPLPDSFFPFFLSLSHLCDRVQTWAKELVAESLFAVQTELKEPRQNKSHLSCLSYLPDERGG